MIDTRGLSCPTPVFMVQKAIKDGAPAAIEVLCDAKVAVENITRLAGNMGYQVAVTTENDEFHLKLSK